MGSHLRTRATTDYHAFLVSFHLSCQLVLEINTNSTKEVSGMIYLGIKNTFDSVPAQTESARPASLSGHKALQ